MSLTLPSPPLYAVLVQSCPYSTLARSSRRALAGWTCVPRPYPRQASPRHLPPSLQPSPREAYPPGLPGGHRYLRPDPPPRACRAPSPGTNCDPLRGIIATRAWSSRRPKLLPLQTLLLLPRPPPKPSPAALLPVPDGSVIEASATCVLETRQAPVPPKILGELGNTQRTAWSVSQMMF